MTLFTFLGHDSGRTLDDQRNQTRPQANPRPSQVNVVLVTSNSNDSSIAPAAAAGVVGIVAVVVVVVMVGAVSVAQLLLLKLLLLLLLPPLRTVIIVRLSIIVDSLTQNTFLGSRNPKPVELAASNRGS